MKFSYRFSNLIGTVYNKGNLLFTSDGNILVSPVGNRINLYDLRKNKSETLPIQSSYNFTSLALSPNGMLLVAVNEPGEALLISIPHRIILHRFDFKRSVADVKFSPNGKYLAVTKENDLFIYQAPSCKSKQYNPFALEKKFNVSLERTSCIDWTSDSRVVAVGGVNMTTKVYALTPYKNFSYYTLGGHTNSIIGCFFEENSLNIYTVCKSGQVSVWECNLKLDGLISRKENIEETDKNSEDEDDILPAEKEKLTVDKVTGDKFFYKRIGRYFLRDSLAKEGFVALTAAAFHRKTRILVTGFANGSFMVNEMPACNQIHSLSLSNQKIASISFNSSGDWIALGTEGIGQLVVWEWQSECFAMKQQGHFNNMNCLAYSHDGMYIASGGEDGKVKIWDTYSGFCYVTFTEHSSAVTGIQFCQNGKVVVSASIDGTVRAFDLIRYRNFKTYTTPEPTQFSCVVVDRSSEIICAGSQESFEIYVWYLRTAHLLSILAGHEAPISHISINPVDLFIASSSWDKTVRLWNISGSKTVRETIPLTSDGLCVAYRPDGLELAVASLDGQILFFHPPTLEQIGYIEGRCDLYVGKRETDMISAKSLLKSQRKITEFGNKALIEERGDLESNSIPVPGSRKIDKSSRSLKPEIAVTCIQFSPTGRAWAATTTEGLLVYSLDNTLVFDPFDLDIDITTISVRDTLKKGNFSQAILMALRLNLTEITQEVLESIAVENIETLASYLPELYAEKLLRFVVDQLETTPHLEFYVKWVHCLLTSHGINFKNRSRANLGTLLHMQKCLSQRLEEIGKMYESYKFICQYAFALNNIKKHKNDSTVEVSEMELISKDEMDVSSTESSDHEMDM
ncbi:periodic tryptophan protein 2 homolog [Nephila pilipes]|uniref:Periodic tryptophan protein 2 homolog n=1 Tax=Nephila pilipes TaxID=299642 RepID=A0A8X6NZA6_NEPPI|nr:periodic tryptophan protein 2 homolog [Nephila pilipes]